jgi:hypothetical protein
LKAQVEGRHIKNPQRYKHNEPTASALGDPPAWASEAQAKAWRGFEAELPWLNFFPSLPCGNRLHPSRAA